MSKIYDVTFNNISGSTPFGQKTEFVKTASLAAANIYQKRKSYIILKTPTYNLGIDEFFNKFGLTGFYIIPDNITNQSILFGTDSLSFATYIVNTIGLTNDYPGITNKTSINFINVLPTPPGPLATTITFGSNSSTYNYVSFTSPGPLTGNSLNLFTPSSPNSATVILTANFDGSGNLQSINFSRNP